MILRNIRFNNLYDAQSIAVEAGVLFNPLADIVIARHDAQGVIMGGVLYNSYTGIGGSINMHVAGFHPRWINRDMLYVCFNYPFVQLGVKKIFGQIPCKNKRAIDFDLKLGFERLVVVEGVYPNDDMLVVAMTREQCRYLDMVLQPGGAR
jgi:RimJ/RimL family protein N-acetyltransferase